MRKEKLDEVDRESIRTFRDMVREKRDQELEDGVLIQGAFRNRGSARAPDTGDESGPDKSARFNLSPEAYQRIWADKSCSHSYQMMLVSCVSLILPFILTAAIAISYAVTNVGFQRRSFACH